MHKEITYKLIQDMFFLSLCPKTFMSFCPKSYVFLSEEELGALSKVECLVSKVAWSSFCLLINLAHVGAEHTDGNE